MKASDIIKAGLNYHTETIEGVGDIELRGMTVDEALKFSKFSEKEEDRMLMFAYLIKICVPAFQGFWWTPDRIKKRLALRVILKISERIMTLSGYGSSGVERSQKDEGGPD